MSVWHSLRVLVQGVTSFLMRTLGDGADLSCFLMLRMSCLIAPKCDARRSVMNGSPWVLTRSSWKARRGVSDSCVHTDSWLS